MVQKFEMIYIYFAICGIMYEPHLYQNIEI
jgi:hypothetical protein